MNSSHCHCLRAGHRLDYGSPSQLGRPVLLSTGKCNICSKVHVVPRPASAKLGLVSGTGQEWRKIYCAPWVRVQLHAESILLLSNRSGPVKAMALALKVDDKMYSNGNVASKSPLDTMYDPHNLVSQITQYHRTRKLSSPQTR